MSYELRAIAHSFGSLEFGLLIHTLFNIALNSRVEIKNVKPGVVTHCITGVLRISALKRWRKEERVPRQLSIIFTNKAL